MCVFDSLWGESWCSMFAARPSRRTLAGGARSAELRQPRSGMRERMSRNRRTGTWKKASEVQWMKRHNSSTACRRHGGSGPGLEGDRTYIKYHRPVPLHGEMESSISVQSWCCASCTHCFRHSPSLLGKRRLFIFSDVHCLSV